jgi:hypothetical protein
VPAHRYAAAVHCCAADWMVLTQHFKKRVMVHVLADIVKVIVLACTRLIREQFWLTLVS